MLGGSDSNVVWYKLGQWSTERAERDAQLASYALHGLRTVKQSYLNALFTAQQEASRISDHNYSMAVRYRDERDKWISRADQLAAEKAALGARALQLEADKAALVAAGNSALDLVDESDDLHRKALDPAKAELEQERQAHEKTAAERNGLKEFQVIMAVLFDAERNGKSTMPAYRKLKRPAEGICFILTSGKDPSQFITQIRAAVDAYQKALTS